MYVADGEMLRIEQTYHKYHNTCVSVAKLHFNNCSTIIPLVLLQAFTSKKKNKCVHVYVFMTCANIKNNVWSYYLFNASNGWLMWNSSVLDHVRKMTFIFLT